MRRLTMSSQSKRETETMTVIERALKRAQELKITKVVVASCSGETALKLIGRGIDVVCVTHQIGFHNPGEDEMPSEMRSRLQEEGVQVLTTTHLMAGIDRALRMKFGGVFPSEIVATTLRMFGEGLKVCVEICGMAVDAGLIKPGEDILALGGTGWGADTALIIRPAHSQSFFETKIVEIVCKPGDF
jgi:hypothetical protein